jgi:hypothetical protein
MVACHLLVSGKIKLTQGAGKLLCFGFRASWCFLKGPQSAISEVRGIL